MSYIYKIINSKNDKIYIGYTSQTLKERFYQHKYEAITTTEKENSSILYKAMRKYGIDCFQIEQIIEFNEEQEDWRTLEKYYIKKYNSRIPNGYNILEGGDKPPIHYGENNNKSKLSNNQFEMLVSDLQNTYTSIKSLAQKYNISESEVGRINNGKIRINKEYNYPLRKYSQQEYYAMQVIRILQMDTTLSNKKIADLIPNYFRANEIAAINNGKKYAYLYDGDFPIRKVIVPNDYQEKQNLAEQVLIYISNNPKTSKKFLQDNFKVGRFTIDKIIKGEYPYKIENVNYPINFKNFNFIKG